MTIRTTCLTLAFVAGAVFLRVPGAAQGCAGDCDGSGGVLVSEIVKGANILLGNALLSTCAAMDSNRDGRILVNDLVAAVGNALCGCMPCPTPPPTSTATRTFTATMIVATPTPPPTPPAVGTVLFSEGWQRARTGTYRPRADVPIGGDVIAGDSGDWLVIDTVTNFPECGESPHFAEVVDEGGSRRLRLHSGNSGSECADNIDVGAITRNPPGARGVDVDLDDDIFLSLLETGGLSTNKPCDAAYLTVTFDQADPLSYVLQRGPGWEDPDDCTSLLITPHALLLDPNQVHHTRNLIADAAALELDRPARITNIVLRIDSDGSATFDDILVFRTGSNGQPTNTRTATPTRTPTPAPCSCIKVKQGTWCLEGGAGAIEDRLTQSGCTITFADQSLRGQICGTEWIVDNERFDIYLECDFDARQNPAVECDGFLDAPQGSGSFVMHAGACE